MMKVLVADDSVPIRERLIERLSHLSDVDVVEAENTTEALQLLHSFCPDVAVLDIRMPGGGGIKVLQEVKKNCPSVVVMIMTNYPYAQYRRKCLDFGADFFFDKSSEFEQVADTIQKMITADAADIARRTAAAQLVAAKEELEKIEQRKRDLSLLSLFNRHGNDQELKDAHAMWEKTFDSIPDLIALFDAEHQIIRVNKAMADHLKIPAAELSGKKCYTYCHGTDHPVEGCPHNEMLKDGREHSVELYDHRLGGWFHVTVSPVFENKKLIGAIHIARDINDRKATEKSLTESEERYRRLFESMQSAFALHEIICDEDGNPSDYRFLEVNPAFEKMTGLSADSIVGQSVKSVFPNTEPYWIDTYGTVALTGRPTHIEEFAAEIGRYFSVRAYSPRRGQFATIFNDVTENVIAAEELRKARDDAEESNRVKTQFLANMSHELRTPLNAIIGLTELLADSTMDPEQDDYVKTIYESGEALLTLISDLLDLSKIELGRLAIETKPFSVCEMIEQAVAVLSPFAGRKGIEIETVIDPSVPETVCNDADRLRQVLVNLLNNAVKFTEKGKVRLSVDCLRVPSGTIQLQFAVEDNGIGMDATVIDRIFEPFHQGDSSSTRVHGGTGLGLTICRNLVQMMGGEISVRSRPGQGSCFRFYVIDRIKEDVVPTRSEDCMSCRGRKVCLWDDDPENLHMLEHLLERCGMSAVFGAGVKDLPACLEDAELAPDAVLCNLDMKGFRENLPRLLKQKKSIPWIAISKWTQPLDDELKSVFDGFLDSPVQAVQLCETFQRLFS